MANNKLDSKQLLNRHVSGSHCDTIEIKQTEVFF